MCACLRTQSALARTTMTTRGRVQVARVTLASRLDGTPHCHLTDLKPTVQPHVPVFNSCNGMYWQVSEVPAEIAARWSKARRFSEAWRWVRMLQPSSMLTSLRLPLSDAQHAYELLDSAQTLCVQFSYPQ